VAVRKPRLEPPEPADLVHRHGRLRELEHALEVRAGVSLVEHHLREVVVVEAVVLRDG
jgi:hypothetical protein